MCLLTESFRLFFLNFGLPQAKALKLKKIVLAPTIENFLQLVV